MTLCWQMHAAGSVSLLSLLFVGLEWPDRAERAGHVRFGSGAECPFILLLRGARILRILRVRRGQDPRGMEWEPRVATFKASPRRLGLLRIGYRCRKDAATESAAPAKTVA